MLAQFDPLAAKQRDLVCEHADGETLAISVQLNDRADEQTDCY